MGQLEIGKCRFGFYVQAQSGPAIIARVTPRTLQRLFGLLVNDLIYSKYNSEGTITDLIYTSANV